MFSNARNTRKKGIISLKVNLISILVVIFSYNKNFLTFLPTFADNTWAIAMINKFYRYVFNAMMIVHAKARPLIPSGFLRLFSDKSSDCD